MCEHREIARILAEHRDPDESESQFPIRRALTWIVRAMAWLVIATSGLKIWLNGLGNPSAVILLTVGLSIVVYLDSSSFITSIPTSLKQLPSLLRNIAGAITIFWPSILYVMAFVLYALMIHNFYDGDGSLLLTFFPCFIACAWVLPLVALMQLILGISIARTDSENAFCHVLSSILVLVLTAGFYSSLSAGNFPTV